MKLTFSPASPFARKIRICAIELGLIDKIELVSATVTPTALNEDYSRDISPVRKLPALILDNGQTIVDSYVIAEYLDELAGGGKLIPVGDTKWQIKSEHAMTQGMLDAMLLCRYEQMLRPKDKQWDDWSKGQWDRAWQGLQWFEQRPETYTRPLDIAQIGLVCVMGYADFRFPDCGWRKQFPKANAFHDKMMQRESVKVSVPPPA